MSIDDRSAEQEQENSDARVRMRRHTRRSFLFGGAAAGATLAAYEWLSHAKQISDLQSPLRRAEQFNAAVSRALFPKRELARTYSRSRSTELRINGDIGQDPHMLLDSWRLQVIGLAHPETYPQYIQDVDLWEYKSSNGASSPQQAGENAPTAQPPKSGGAPGTDPKLRTGQQVAVQQTVAIPVAPASDTTRTPGIVLSMADLRKLPYAEQVTQFKCIEGWSQITSFGGVRFADFVKAYPPAGNPRYVVFETADGTFSSSLDMESMQHPQTLLCYEMHGRPLTPGHGAPLRLATPFKYGYKQIKQIASLTYTNTREADFWEGYGYDWYADL